MNRRGFLRNGIAGIGALALGAKFRPKAAEKALLPVVATSGYAQVEPVAMAPSVTTTATTSANAIAWYWVNGKGNRTRA